MNLSLITGLLLIGLTILVCPNDPYCLTCKSQKCTDCQKGFPDAAGLCVIATPGIANCLFYEAATQCRTCQYGYALATNKNTCDKIANIPNCLVLKASNECSVCDNSIKAASNKCDSGAKCTITNCNLCKVDGTTETCEVCNSGFTMKIVTADNVETRTCMTASTPNCRVTDVSDNTCTTCDLNFSIDPSNQCAKNQNSPNDVWGYTQPVPEPSPVTGDSPPPESNSTKRIFSGIVSFTFIVWMVNTSI